MAYALQLKSLVGSQVMEQIRGGPAPAQLKACSLIPLAKKEVEGVQGVESVDHNK